MIRYPNGEQCRTDNADNFFNVNDESLINFDTDLNSCNEFTEKVEDCNSSVAHMLLEAREEYKMSTSSSQFLCQETQKLIDLDRAVTFKKMLPYLKTDLNVNKHNNLQSLLNSFSQVSQAFGKFSTGKCLDNYISNKEHFVRPTEIQLGFNPVKCVSETYQYIPIFKTLDVLLKHEDVLAQIFKQRPDSEILSCYRDGDVFKNHPLFSTNKQSLQINIYDDEFVIVNPLGNKTKKYKILAFYFTLGNFDTNINSKLYSIQLLLLAKSIHVKKYGVYAVLTPVLEDLNFLEKTGITIKFRHQTLTFLGSVSLIISDNLAAHWLAGFQENFSTVKRVCRFCMCKRSDMASCFNSDSCVEDS